MTASLFNTHLRDNLNYLYLGASYRCSAYATAVQSLVTATFTAITFDSEAFDVGTLHDTVTNPSRFTIPSGGDGAYLLVGTITFAANATNGRQAFWRKSGAAFPGGSEAGISPAAAAANTGLRAVAIAALVAADYVELFGWQNSGGPLNTGVASSTDYVNQNSAQVLRLVS